jgi:cation:H+ antiporter
MIVFATVALWVGSDALVFGAKNFALSAGIPEELIGFTLIAIGTSLPELAASLALLKKGESGMLLGNVLGSNMFNTGLVGGVAGVLGPVLSNTPYPWIDYLFMILLTALFCFWLKGRKIEKKEGYLLLALYVVATSTTWKLNG